jgi:hypothetical protein
VRGRFELKTDTKMKRQEPISPSKLHLGRLVKAELERQGRTGVWLAKQVNCTPENLYKVFRAQWLTMPLLFRISRALGHDFFKDCSEQLGF